MATRKQLEEHIQRLKFQLQCKERDNGEEYNPQAIRRHEQAVRYKHREYTTKAWLYGQWRITNEPCKCGRNHYTVQSRSGIGVTNHCPLVWWGWLMLFSDDRDQTAALLDSIVRPIVNV